MRSAVRGDTLIAVRPAYDSDPTTPAAPVPEPHADTSPLHTVMQIHRQTDTGSIGARTPRRHLTSTHSHADTQTKR